MKQKILCISAQELFKNGKWNGLLQDNLPHYYKLLLDKSEFRVRQDLENDPQYKQIIPQVILKYQGKYFLHRQKSANESRLNSLCPLPLGGHVEAFDSNQDKDILQVALERELHEEAFISSNIVNREFLGIIYLEDGNLVNHMHLGLLYIFTLDGDKVKMHEDGLETIGFVDENYLITHLDELTFWSKIFVTEFCHIK